MSTVADKTEVRKDCTVQLIQVLNSHNGSDQSNGRYYRQITLSNGINIRTKSRLNDTKRLFDNYNPEDRIYEPTKRSLHIYSNISCYPKAVKKICYQMHSMILSHFWLKNLLSHALYDPFPLLANLPYRIVCK